MNNKPNILTLRDILKLSKGKLIHYLESIVNHHSPTAWLLTPPGGGNRITVVCHIDTVFDSRRRSPGIFYDRDSKVLWSPDGLGADDRAGVYGAIQVYHAMPDNLKPNLLFCDEEEKGGTGAQDACQVFESLLENTLFFIELDRRGQSDCVFYNEEPNDFRSFIESHGFRQEIGSFSDILFLGSYFQVCATNLSVGYYEEHQRTEHLWIEDLNRTISATQLIIESGMRLGKRWEHRAASWKSRYLFNDTGRTYYDDGKYYGKTVFRYDPDDYEFADDPDDPEPVDTYIQKSLPTYQPINEAMSTKLSRKERRRLRKEMAKRRDPFWYERGP